MPYGTMNMPYGAFPAQTGTRQFGLDPSKLEELEQAKGGKLLTPDQFYKHPAKNVFGSYSTYVDWYAGGKKRKEDERSLYQRASSGRWTPGDYGTSTGAQIGSIKAGGMATEGRAGRDILGRPTVSAPGVGQVPVEYDYRQQERVERERKRRYDLETERAKREAFTPEERIKLDKDVQAAERVRQADERIAQGQQKIDNQVNQFAERMKNQYTIEITNKDGSKTRVNRDVYKFQNKLVEIAKKHEGSKALEMMRDENRKALAEVQHDLKRQFETEISHTHRKELLKLAQEGRLNLAKEQAQERFAIEERKHELKEKGAKSRAQLDLMKSKLLQIEKAQVIALQSSYSIDALEKMKIKAEADFGGVVAGGDVAAKPLEFNSAEEADAANLPPGTEIVIGGRRAVVD